MTCTIYNHALNREMDRLFDNLLERTGLIQGDRYASIPVCIWDEPDRYCIELDLPGVKKKTFRSQFKRACSALPLSVTVKKSKTANAGATNAFTRTLNARLLCRTPSKQKTSTRNSSTAS